MTDKTFITILPFMVQDLKLKGNELIIYAIIHGFSQDGESSFYGSLAYLSEQTGVTKRSVISVLKRLVNAGLIDREDVFLSGKRFVKYKVCNNFTGGEKTSLGGEKTSPVDGEKTSPNMKYSLDMKEDNKTHMSKNRINYQSIVDFYNEKCPSLPRVIKLSDKRRSAIRSLLTDFTVEEVGQAFIKAEASEFLKGKEGSGWKANFDWLINKNNLLKVAEGVYDSKRKLKEGDDGYYENDIAW